LASTISISWKLVSENPAKAAGLGDTKGRIAPGCDADLVLLNALDGMPSSVKQTLVKGKAVFQRAAWG
jgi:alpha-D-ribose 1-methylphosphonate 5-triphosphate diphosphatase